MNSQHNHFFDVFKQDSFVKEQQKPMKKKLTRQSKNEKSDFQNEYERIARSVSISRNLQKPLYTQAFRRIKVVFDKQFVESHLNITSIQEDRLKNKSNNVALRHIRSLILETPEKQNSKWRQVLRTKYVQMVLINPTAKKFRQTAKSIAWNCLIRAWQRGQYERIFDDQAHEIMKRIKIVYQDKPLDLINQKELFDSTDYSEFFDSANCQQLFNSANQKENIKFQSLLDISDSDWQRITFQSVQTNYEAVMMEIDQNTLPSEQHQDFDLWSWN